MHLPISEKQKVRDFKIISIFVLFVDFIEKCLKLVQKIIGNQLLLINYYFYRFRHHIKMDHNPENYIFYIDYILKKKETEFTGIESYVKECLE
jgi:hypothetical protein